MKNRISIKNILLTTTFLLVTDNAFAEEQSTQLETIVIRGSADGGDTAGTTVAKSTLSATKTGTAAIETPQSVTTVTRKQINDQNPQTVSEALRYTAGVLSDRDSNSRYDSVFLRGFGAFGTATSYVNYLDGLKLQRGQALTRPGLCHTLYRSVLPRPY